MSSSPDPQTWIFPPLGAAALPSDVSAAFGPISKGDKIKLEWAPANEEPEIALICANDGTTYTVSSGGNASPYTFQFTQSINNGTSHVCWMFFPGTSLGNTLTFEYNNGGTGSSVTWQQDSQLAAALSGNGGSGNAVSTATVTKTVTAPSGSGSGGSAAGSAQTVTVTETEVITQYQSSYTTTISNPSTTYVSTGFSVLAASTAAPTNSTVLATGNNNSQGISAGVAAGIAVAATVGFALLCLLCFFIVRRIRGGRDDDRGAVVGRSEYPPDMSAGGGISAPLVGGHQYGRGAGAGPAPVPHDYKYVPPQMQSTRGYYAPGQGMGSGASHPLVGSGAPRRTIHEIE